MSLRREIQRIFHAYGIAPRKRLSQSFLLDEETMGKMVSYASLSGQDVVLEVGAGLGFLTERLAEVAGHVITVEIDAMLVRILKDRLRGYGNVTILQGDILKLAIPSFRKVVSTPPYSISSPLLFWLFERRYEEAVLAFQEEFARRLSAGVGSKDYGRLTISAYFRAEAELLDTIPRELFWPLPKVDSRIVRLRPKEPPLLVEDPKIFFEVVGVIFSQKNRKLRNAVMPFLSKFKVIRKEALQLADDLPFCYRRPRELAPEEIGLTVNEIIRRLRKSGLL